MYIRTPDGIADSDLGYLQDLLTLIDEKLSSIIEVAQLNSDPDSDGLYDQGEYFIGVAITAIQQYITSTYTQFKINKSEALGLPPSINENLTFVAAINAGANFWKHRDEWGLGTNVSREIDSLRPQARRTIETIEVLTPWDDYTLSNLLASLTPSGNLRLTELVPYIVKWRDAVDSMNREVNK